MKDLATHVIVVINQEGCEALYVGGELVETEGDTVYATDIADVSKGILIQFSHVLVDHDSCDQWPLMFEDLLCNKSGDKSSVS